MTFALLSALRPRQWIKNGFVLAALIFSRHLFDVHYVWRSIGAAAIFVVLSGAVYLINDVCDREKDRLHPGKRDRPVASGRLPVGIAVAAAAVMGPVGLAAAFRLDPQFGAVSAIYTLLNLGYSFALKHIVILDVMLIASGFLLRAIGGAFAIDVSISSWFILCTMLLSLFLGFVKRRQEIMLLETGAGGHRKSLEEYTPAFLDQAIGIVTAGALVSYALYTMSAEVAEKLGTPHLGLTIPFVIYGLLRYLYLVYVKGEGGDTASTILGDTPMLINLAFWLVTLVAVLYFGDAEGVGLHE